ncbi:hypothetical protein ABZ707_29325 [Streptomyces sp. NPDC006923]|uniref:hypothetical protein n=1 Tax=Streptomyces sp. NPDC006923 TaxID=3155355 RepID=UPI0033DB3F1A
MHEAGAQPLGGTFVGGQAVQVCPGGPADDLGVGEGSGDVLLVVGGERAQREPT